MHFHLLSWIQRDIAGFYREQRFALLSSRFLVVPSVHNEC